MRYQTTMQTIPLDFGERVYFFPLGPQTSDGNARIEIQLALHPYKADAPQAETKDAALPKDSMGSKLSSTGSGDKRSE